MCTKQRLRHPLSYDLSPHSRSPTHGVLFTLTDSFLPFFVFGVAANIRTRADPATHNLFLMHSFLEGEGLGFSEQDTCTDALPKSAGPMGLGYTAEYAVVRTRRGVGAGGKAGGGWQNVGRTRSLSALAFLRRLSCPCLGCCCCFDDPVTRGSQPHVTGSFGDVDSGP